MSLKYHFVEFVDSRTNDIVHRSWLVGNNFCRWPLRSKGNVSELVKAAQTPEDDWEIFRIKIKKSSGMV